MNQNLITILISVMTLFLSAYLAYYFGIQSTRTKEKDDRKKNLNKLLFHLLIVRKVASDKIRMNKIKDDLFEKFKSFFRDKLEISNELINDEESLSIFKSQWNILDTIIDGKFVEESKRSKESIVLLINEFSEINPLFALTLKGYDLEEKNAIVNSLFESMPKDDESIELFMSAISPAIEYDFVKQIDKIIHETTSKLDSKTQREVQELLIFYDETSIDKQEFEEYMNRLMIEPLTEKLQNESLQS